MRQIQINQGKAIVIVVITAISAGAYFCYSYWAGMQKEFISTRAELASTTARLYETEILLNSIRNELQNTKEGRDILSIALEDEQLKLNSLAEQYKEATAKLEVVKRLEWIDPELLQKYSKIYFLNENYEPKNLVEIDPEFTPNGKKILFNGNALHYLENMTRDAGGRGLLVTSAYRSFGEQSGLKSSYSVRYGSGANAFSADQGYSEHQLGTAVDFVTKKNGNLDDFGKTAAYEWLKENAHKYGFILSYPEDNSYYQFEPWHWRFVGRNLATKLHEEGKHFYDMDQREIDGYLISFFD